MDKHEFEQFVTEHGKDILRFCRMNAGSTECGNELYQDTMVKLLEKQKKLDAAQNIKSYACRQQSCYGKTKRKNTPCETAFFQSAVSKNTWNRAVCPARVRMKKRPSSRC